MNTEMSAIVRRYSLKRVPAFITTNTIEMALHAVSSSFAITCFGLYFLFAVANLSLHALGAYHLSLFHVSCRTSFSPASYKFDLRKAPLDKILYRDRTFQLLGLDQMLAKRRIYESCC